MQNKVWVIIPSYNKHHFLSDAIDSVIAQSYENFNVIIVNDYIDKRNSNDKCNEIEKLIQDKNDHRIRLIHNNKNLGIPGSRNVAIREFIRINIEYIFFLDHDDVWIDRDKIKNQLEIMRNQDIWVLWTQFNIVNNGNTIIGQSNNPLDYQSTIDSMLFITPLLMSTLCINTSVLEYIGLFNEDYNGSDDKEILIRMLKKYKWYNMPDVTTNYRYFTDNASLQKSKELARNNIDIIWKYGKWYNWYYRSLLLSYLRLLVPFEYKKYFRFLRKYISPLANNMSY